ncbi:MAG: UDP-N-acetylmuramoyl-L-alanine--D-glutamate ligase [Rhodospirillaceae bacterium]
MIDVFFMFKMPIAVFGLGRTGIASAKALAESEAEVWAWDDNEDARQRAREQDIPLTDLYICNWKELTSLVLSPGIPLHHPEPHPVVNLAKAAGCEIISDIELLARSQRDASYIGITGTNGKSTTTALIGHIMQLAGREVEVGGNLGTPALSLDGLGEEGSYILEMSSYQLDLTVSITFDIAVLLNISADHLDRHGGMDGYVAAKRQIFNRQTEPKSAIIGVDDKYCEAIYEDLADVGDQIVVPISGKRRIHGGVYVVNGVLVDDTDGQEVPVTDLKEIPSLQGPHNWQNAAAAYAACKRAGVEPRVIMACLQSYPGLVHRQEPVEVVDGVAFINDSKATNADAAAKALACYDNVYWIAGGRPKDGGISTLSEYFPRIRHSFLVGEAALQFGQELDGKVPFTVSGEIAKAVEDAFKLAKKEKADKPIVLLSPACASFDQFANFEDRGDVFKDAVEGLKGDHLDPMEAPDAFRSVAAAGAEGAA